MRHTDKFHLFCIPYAGGSAAATYGRWARHLPDTVKVIPLEIAGHGKRMLEPFHDSIEAVVNDLLSAVAPVARSSSYAIYGHSMGTMIVYELIKAVAAMGLPAPHTIFLSGRNSPHHAYPGRKLSLLNDELFLNEIRKLGGTPDAFFDMKDLVKAFLPILRNDYRIIEQYQSSEPRHVTSADLVFLLSDKDALIGKPDVYEWRNYTSGSFTLKEFVGGHFFIHDYTEAICRIIAETLEPASV